MNNLSSDHIVEVAEGLQSSIVLPALAIKDADGATIDAGQIAAAMVQVAHRFQLHRLTDLPMAMDVDVIGEEGVATFAFTLSPNLVEVRTGGSSQPRVQVTFEKACDAVLVAQGLPLLTVVSAGRAALQGSTEDLLASFGMLRSRPAAGRRPFADLSEFLIDCQHARPRQVRKLLDAFGRADLAGELNVFFAQAIELSGLGQVIEPTTIQMVIGEFTAFCLIRSDGCMTADQPGPEGVGAVIEMPKMETFVARLLGEIGDMDAILSRKLLVTGPAVDDLMPIFERISSGLTSFTSMELATDWSFPSPIE